jgi:multidrug efflux pump subunit AcrA (membrane-fusion protein)
VTVIPRRALLEGLDDPRVYVLDGTVARLRAIVAEALDDTRVAVRGGLRAGEVVIVSGQLNLRDGARVTVH